MLLISIFPDTTLFSELNRVFSLFRLIRIREGGVGANPEFVRLFITSYSTLERCTMCKAKIILPFVVDRLSGPSKRRSL